MEWHKRIQSQRKSRLSHATKAFSFPLFLPSVQDGGQRSVSRHGRFTRGKERRCQSNRRLLRSQDRSGPFGRTYFKHLLQNIQQKQHKNRTAKTKNVGLWALSNFFAGISTCTEKPCIYLTPAVLQTADVTPHWLLWCQESIHGHWGLDSSTVYRFYGQGEAVPVHAVKSCRAKRSIAPLTLNQGTRWR